MKKVLRYIVPCSLLIVFWLIRMFRTGTADGLFIRSAVSGALFLAAAVCVRVIPNRHAALAAGLAAGVAFCIVQPSAVFDTLPALLLCCWLRCYLEKEKGDYPAGWFELITDLIYLDLAAIVVRLVRYGYSLTDINFADIQMVPDVILMALILLLFAGLFAFNAGGAARTDVPAKDKRKKGGGRGSRGMVGVIPVFTAVRTFWGFCAVLLSASLLLYTDSRLIEETNTLARTGLRLMFLPWMILLFVIADAFLPRIDAVRRMSE